jgi:predicted transcriptional regulator
MDMKEKLAEMMMGKMNPEEKQRMMGAMMDRFFAAMSAAEKQKMMDGMMEKFMASMTAEEKQSMMQNMMPKMMGQMMGGGMMGSMMSKMMGGMKNRMNQAADGVVNAGIENSEGGETAETPWDMCKKMMSKMAASNSREADTTPEMRQLFDEWIAQIEEEIMDFIGQSESIDVHKISEHFKLSDDSVASVLTRLAQKGKIHYKKENN